jgi:hypothetical protein
MGVIKMLVKDCKQCGCYYNYNGTHWCDKNEVFINMINTCYISKFLNKQKRLPVYDCVDIKQGDLFNE